MREILRIKLDDIQEAVANWNKAVELINGQVGIIEKLLPNVSKYEGGPYPEALLDSIKRFNSKNRDILLRLEMSKYGMYLHAKVHVVKGLGLYDVIHLASYDYTKGWHRGHTETVASKLDADLIVSASLEMARLLNEKEKVQLEVEKAHQILFPISNCVANWEGNDGG